MSRCRLLPDRPAAIERQNQSSASVPPDQGLRFSTRAFPRRIDGVGRSHFRFRQRRGQQRVAVG